MKPRHLALALFLAAPLLASALPTGAGVIFRESQALTRAAPTGATDGFPLKSIISYRYTVCAASGQTLTAPVTVNMYLQNADGLWAINPALQQTSDPAGGRCAAFPGIKNDVRTGRALPAVVGATVSGGTTVTMLVEGQST